MNDKTWARCVLLTALLFPAPVALVFSWDIKSTLYLESYYVPLSYWSLLHLVITVSLLYFQLSREDHRWWWISFTNGGMIGFFIYAYSFYYWFHRSGMSGLLQASFYYGYMGIISFTFFLMLGSAGFQLSLVFVKYIYGRVKCD